jgi:hypothetical protein
MDQRYRQGGSLPRWFWRRLSKAGIDRTEFLSKHWADHSGTYKVGGYPDRVFMSCPYDISEEDIRDIMRFCELMGCTFSIYGYSPYHQNSMAIVIHSK